MTTQITLRAILHAEKAHAIFIWQPLPRTIPPFRSVSCFAIRFLLSTTILHGACDLSLLLLRFTSRYRALTSPKTQLLDVSFYATLHTVYGVMIFDSGLQCAYDFMWDRALADPFYLEHQLCLPMSTWPDSGRGMTLLAHSDVVQQLITTTE